ncbi:MAG TPA: co-chaperone GroES [Myxococcota bacterium]|nr:co-chaperone GroES [Myxococcota bacterium]
MNVQPLHDRILVKRFPEEAKTPGGLLIPDAAKEEPNEGRVIAIGKGEPLHDGNVRGLEVALGDRVLFTKGSGTELRIAGQLHLILREDDVLAIVG